MRIVRPPSGALLAAAFAALLALFLPACAPKVTEDALKQRAQEYWNLKVRKDYLRAYDYLDPAAREQVPLNEWLAGFGAVEWPAADVLGAEIRGSKGLAKIKYKYVVLASFARGQTGEDTVEERWIVRRGRWYKVHVPKSLKGQEPGWDW